MSGTLTVTSARDEVLRLAAEGYGIDDIVVLLELPRKSRDWVRGIVLGVGRK